MNAGTYQGSTRLVVEDIEHSTVKLIQDFYAEDFGLFGYSLEPRRKEWNSIFTMVLQ